MERFSIVTFTPSGISIRTPLDRAQVERLIGQEFALGRKLRVKHPAIGEQ